MTVETVGVSVAPGDLMDCELFKAAHRVADIVFEYVDRGFTSGSNRPSMEDCRRAEANPYYNQTASGLFLEICYGTPGSLWTPWGKWAFVGSGSGTGNQFNEVVEKLQERFGLTVYRPRRYDPSYGEIGPIYALTRVDDQPLPPAAELDYGQYRSYQKVKKAWRQLTKQCR